MKLTDENGKEYEFEELGAQPIQGMRGNLTPIKPKPKKIDMSVCIESGIDCEFSNKPEVDWKLVEISKLLEVSAGDYMYWLSKTSGFRHCRPRFNHIHASPTGWDKCPIPEGFRIKVWTHCNDWTQDSDQWDKDIIMIESIGITKGYEL